MSNQVLHHRNQGQKLNHFTQWILASYFYSALPSQEIPPSTSSVNVCSKTTIPFSRLSVHPAQLQLLYQSTTTQVTHVSFTFIG